MPPRPSCSTTASAPTLGHLGHHVPPIPHPLPPRVPTCAPALAPPPPLSHPPLASPPFAALVPRPRCRLCTTSPFPPQSLLRPRPRPRLRYWPPPAPKLSPPPPVLVACEVSLTFNTCPRLSHILLNLRPTALAIWGQELAPYFTRTAIFLSNDQSYGLLNSFPGTTNGTAKWDY